MSFNYMHVSDVFFKIIFGIEMVLLFKDSSRLLIMQTLHRWTLILRGIVIYVFQPSRTSHPCHPQSVHPGIVLGAQDHGEPCRVQGL